MHAPSAPTSSPSRRPYGNWHPTGYTSVCEIIQLISIIPLSHWLEVSEELCGYSDMRGCILHRRRGLLWALPYGNYNPTCYTLGSWNHSVNCNHCIGTLPGGLKKLMGVLWCMVIHPEFALRPTPSRWKCGHWNPHSYTPSFYTIQLIPITALKHWGPQKNHVGISACDDA